MDITPAAGQPEPYPRTPELRAQPDARETDFTHTLSRTRESITPLTRPVRPLTPPVGEASGVPASDRAAEQSIEQAYLRQLTRLTGERALNPAMTTQFPASVLHYAGQFSSQVWNAAIAHQQPGHTALPNPRERESAPPRVKPVDSAGGTNRL